MSEAMGQGPAASVSAATARMGAMPQGYADLLIAAEAVCHDDDRVQALWVGGSVARGAADAGSDLDLLVAVRDEAFEEFAAGAVAWLHGCADLVLARALPGLPGGVFATTSDCLRLDLVTERVSDLEETAYRYRVAVLDPDGLDARIPPGGHEPGPDLEAMAALVEEALRQQAIVPAAVVARSDWLLGVVGVGAQQQLLYQIFVAANAPLPVMGVKQWSSRLTPAQRDVMAGLPSPQAERESVLVAMRAVRRAIAAHGRAAVEAHGVAWPNALHDAVTAYWHRAALL